MGKCLYLVLPCYNEEDVIFDSGQKLKSFLKDLMEKKIISPDSKILFVDDGSVDTTWKKISELHSSHKMYEGIRLAKNRGHQAAILAGMIEAAKRADMVITMDVDLQQDMYKIPEFIERYNDHCDIVYGKRNSRNTDSVFKKVTATIYYKLMKLLGCELVEQSADYRLLSHKAIEALSEYGESNLFVRGLVPELGFKTGIVYFDVKPRMIGESKYTLKKMLTLAFDGITSFSIKPVRIISFLGGVVSILSIVMIIYALFAYFHGSPISGWVSTSISLWFLGGVELLAMGVIGEYVGRTYMESKKRPRYFIEESLMNGKENEKDAS